jgi:predicted nuclease with TOPRIM domain
MSERNKTMCPVCGLRVLGGCECERPWAYLERITELEAENQGLREMLIERGKEVYELRDQLRNLERNAHHALGKALIEELAQKETPDEG